VTVFGHQCHLNIQCRFALDSIVVVDRRVFVANLAGNSISELIASSGSLIRINH
jgi:hypothetical protein